MSAELCTELARRIHCSSQRQYCHRHVVFVQSGQSLQSMIPIMIIEPVATSPSRSPATLRGQRERLPAPYGFARSASLPHPFGNLRLAPSRCRGTEAPAGADWIHEIKHDGYRLIFSARKSACGCSPVTATTGAVSFQGQKPGASHLQPGAGSAFGGGGVIVHSMIKSAPALDGRRQLLIVPDGFVANRPVDLDQYSLSGIWTMCKRAANWELDMGECSESRRVCRRSALALFGYAAVFGLVASPAILTVSDADAQTPTTPATEAPKSGTERRQERRAGRAERRQERREGRAERRQERREGRAERRQARRTGRAERREERHDGAAEEKK